MPGLSAGGGLSSSSGLTRGGGVSWGVGLNFGTGGVPQFLVIGGVLAILLLGVDGQPLQGADSQYLYGVA